MSNQNVDAAAKPNPVPTITTEATSNSDRSSDGTGGETERQGQDRGAEERPGDDRADLEGREPEGRQVLREQDTDEPVRQPAGHAGGEDATHCVADGLGSRVLVDASSKHSALRRTRQSGEAFAELPQAVGRLGIDGVRHHAEGR